MDLSKLETVTNCLKLVSLLFYFIFLHSFLGSILNHFSRSLQLFLLWLFALLHTRPPLPICNLNNCMCYFFPRSMFGAFAAYEIWTDDFAQFWEHSSYIALKRTKFIIIIVANCNRHDTIRPGSNIFVCFWFLVHYLCRAE